MVDSIIDQDIMVNFMDGKRAGSFHSKQMDIYIAEGTYIVTRYITNHFDEELFNI